MDLIFVQVDLVWHQLTSKNKHPTSKKQIWPQNNSSDLKNNKSDLKTVHPTSKTTNLTSKHNFWPQKHKTIPQNTASDFKNNQNHPKTSKNLPKTSKTFKKHKNLNHHHQKTSKNTKKITKATKPINKKTKASQITQQAAKIVTGSDGVFPARRAFGAAQSLDFQAFFFRAAWIVRNSRWSSVKALSVRPQEPPQEAAGEPKRGTRWLQESSKQVLLW